MLKKLIAGIASVTLALGMVALTTSPASAAAPGPSQVVSADCETVDVDLKGYDQGETNHVTVYLDGAAVADVADFGVTFKESYGFATIAASHTYRVTVAVDPSGVGNYDSGVQTVSNCAPATPSPSPTPTDTLPDDMDENITICHWEPAQGGKYTDNTVDKNSIINLPNGHKDHENDIIPEFDYVEDGVQGHFDGLNWDALGQFLYNNGGCNGAVVPVDPQKFVSVCTDGQASTPTYSVAATLYVQYQVSVNGGPWTNVGSGSHDATPGSTYDFQAIVTLPGGDPYTVDLGTLTFGAQPDCRQLTTVEADPQFHDAFCDVEEDTVVPGNFDIFAAAHVTFTVSYNDGVAVPIGAGNHPANQGDKVEIFATPDLGWTLNGTSFWEHTFATGILCDPPTLDTWQVNATKTDQSCSANGTIAGTIIVGDVPGGPFLDEVNYFIDGNLVTQAVTAVAAGTHTVTAEAIDDADGLTGYPEGGWELTIAGTSGVCDLTTLALTGAGDNPAGWAGLGYYLLVAGLALIAVRTLRRRDEVKQ